MLSRTHDAAAAVWFIFLCGRIVVTGLDAKLRIALHLYGDLRICHIIIAVAAAVVITFGLLFERRGLCKFAGHLVGSAAKEASNRSHLSVCALLLGLWWVRVVVIVLVGAVTSGEEDQKEPNECDRVPDAVRPPVGGGGIDEKKEHQTTKEQQNGRGHVWDAVILEEDVKFIHGRELVHHDHQVHGDDVDVEKAVVVIQQG